MTIEQMIERAKQIAGRPPKARSGGKRYRKGLMGTGDRPRIYQGSTRASHLVSPALVVGTRPQQVPNLEPDPNLHGATVRWLARQRHR